MPATTPKGYPYPLGTDRVMDGDDAIHALAAAVDKKAVVHGSVTLTATSAGVSGTGVAVTFPAGSFVAVPTMIAIAGSSRLTPGPANTTPTGFLYNFSNWSPGNSPNSLGWWAALSNDPI